MKYENYYTSVASSIRTSKWYETEALTKCLHILRMIDYNSLEERKNAAKILKQLDTRAPYAENVRFPEGKYYITEAYADWVRKFNLLRETLDENLKENQRYGYAFGLYFYSINAILKKIEDKHETFSRSSFEDHYTLVWQD